MIFKMTFARFFARLLQGCESHPGSTTVLRHQDLRPSCSSPSPGLLNSCATKIWIGAWGVVHTKPRKRRCRTALPSSMKHPRSVPTDVRWDRGRTADLCADGRHADFGNKIKRSQAASLQPLPDRPRRSPDEPSETVFARFFDCHLSPACDLGAENSGPIHRLTWKAGLDRTGLSKLAPAGMFPQR